MSRLISHIVLVILAVASACGCQPDDAGDVGAADSKSVARAPAGSDGSAIGVREGLGKHGQRITTDSDSAQVYFDQGLRLAYAFNHPAAVASFEKAASFDPECAMCYWGIAWASGPNINAALTPEGGEAAHQAIQRALELAVGVTERERAYIEAMAFRYEEDPMTGRARQDTAYARAAVSIADSWPADPDAQVLAVEALMDLSPWDYWNEDGTPRPDTEALLGRLLPVTKDHLEHAGACHFYIHAVEKFYPERAVPCAERLAALMPGAGHIVHMPSHIYIRVGRYADAIESNKSAVHAHGMHDEPAPDRGPDEFDQGYGSHNYHFLSFAAQMAGNRALALTTAHELESRVDPEMMRAPGLGALQHYLVTPLRVMVRFGMWNEILAEPAPPVDLAYPIGTWRYARGMALARTDRPDEASAELAELRALLEGDTLEGVTVWELNSAHGLLAIGERVLTGEIEAAHGNTEAAIAALAEGVAMEAALTYDEPPPWHLPVRHVLGAVLLDAGLPGEAEVVYAESLEQFAENGYALRGLELALEAQGKAAEAEAVHERFEIAWRAADVELPGSRF
jgi:tetratricopeptide (TPR) repeat protein